MLRLCLALIGIVSAAAPATAATYYAKLSSPVAQAKVIDRTIVWSCGPDACVGSTSRSPALFLCQRLAKTAGRLESFIVNGTAFGASELDRCNASAPAPSPPALSVER